jgi:hypothetical protein
MALEEQCMITAIKLGKIDEAFLIFPYNSNGVASYSPGLARQRRDYPGVIVPSNFPNPKVGCLGNGGDVF